MKILSLDKQKGFTLIEVIATIVIAGVVGAMTFSYFGKSFVEGPKPVSRLNKALGLQTVMENITRDYIENYAGSDTDLSNLKTKIGSEGSTYNNTYGSYKLIYNRFIKFTGGTEDTPTMMDPKNLLKVTIERVDPVEKERLTALFSTGGATGSSGTGGCGGGGVCKGVSVSISPTSASIATGATQQFTATVSGTTDTSVTWSATGGSVDTNGLYTAPSTAGTYYYVTAKSNACSKRSATATVTVTGSCSDTTPPTVSSTSPSSGSTGVAVNSPISVTFSEAMDASTINTTTFTVNGVTGTVTGNGTTYTFTPSSNLAYNTTYTATITTGVKDACGNAILSNYSWSFTTAASGGGDTTPPTVSTTCPTNGQTVYRGTTTIKATFSEAMDPNSITAAGVFTLKVGTNSVSGTVSYNSSNYTATFTTTTLSASTNYTATITTGAKDAAGNNMSGNYQWSFTSTDKQMGMNSCP